MSHLRFVAIKLTYARDDITLYRFELKEVLKKETKMGDVIRSQNHMLLMVHGGDVVSAHRDSIKLNN
jgi:hypothetical protein